MTSVLKKSRGSKGKSESMHEDFPSQWGSISRGQSTEEVDKLISYIGNNIIGKDSSFYGPYGRRRVVYCDYNGSGRALQWIEEFMERHVLPAHATKCSGLSYTSGQCEIYRAESKIILRRAVNASADDVMILGGSLQRTLRALRPQRVVVFVSSRETEKQLAPWRECRAEIVKIPESKEGFIDLNNLELRLREYTGTGLKMIGFFSAVSKLTGVLADDVATTLLLHQYGAWSFWDFTLVAPSSTMDMNPTFPGVEDQMVKKDALFFNCEKFAGGLQGPYIAVVKKHVFKDSLLFTDDVEELSERIEEWSPTEAVRAALVMQLRDTVGLPNIADRQDNITRQVLSFVKNIPELILLGSESPTMRRLPIFSLMVKHPRGTFLHHNFVCAVLNDVFGIQARGGLNGYLNYGSDILGIDEKLLREYEKLLDTQMQQEISHVRKINDPKTPDLPLYNEHLRPGFFRISLPFYISEYELAFVLEALKMVATEGWKILPQYVVNTETAQWRHHASGVHKNKISLHSLRFHDEKITIHEKKVSGSGIFPQTYTECLQTARNLFNRARKLAMKCSIVEPNVDFNPRIDYLRWFMLPREAHDLLLGRSMNVKHIVPFDPSGYTGARRSLHYTRSSAMSSPVLGISPRHFSLSAIDDCQIFRLKQKEKFYSRESSLREHQEDTDKPKSQVVEFAVGESVSPLKIKTQIKSWPQLVRSRCYSLGSDGPPVPLSAETKMNLGLQETSPNNIYQKTSFCNCGSQTDLQSLDDVMISSGKTFPFSAESSTSISDCSQIGRTSPTTSLTSHTSEDLQTYVKEMTKEMAKEIKSEIREVISKVDDILENSDSIEQLNASINSSQSDKNSVSVVDVAEYLMGMSKEMASEVKHEIREMVNQVDEIISPESSLGNSRSRTLQSCRRRVGSGPELGLDLNKTTQRLKKCPTSPVLQSQYTNEEYGMFKNTTTQSPIKSQIQPSKTPSPSSLLFNSRENSTPQKMIQVVGASESSNLPKSLTSNKLSFDDICNDVNCRICSVKKYWCQNASVSSQDSGINMTFTETDSYLDFVKWRMSSDPSTNKCNKPQGRSRKCQKYENSEVPDIIEGVQVCSKDHVVMLRTHNETTTGESDRVVFQISDDSEKINRTTSVESKRSSRSSNASSSSSERSSRSSGYGTDVQRPTQEEFYYDRREPEVFKADMWEEEQDNSSACSDNSLNDYTLDDEGKWHCPPKSVWKPSVEAIQEYNMIRPGDKVLVCLSGGRNSIALLHTVHQYQFYARAKGIHFSVGALFVQESKTDVDPLPLMTYCRSLGVKFIYQEKMDDEEEEDSHMKTSEVSRWASRSVRRRIYTAVAAHGYNVAAVAQHLDRAAETFITNVFHFADLTTIKAHCRVREHNVRIIRPFIYVRARSLTAFARSNLLPEFRITDNSSTSDCQPDDLPEGTTRISTGGASFARSASAPTGTRFPTRHLLDPLLDARHLLTAQELHHPHLYNSLRRALHPLISSRSPGKDMKEHRHRKKSVIQMKNGVPVYDSDEGTEEEPVP